MAPTEPTDEVPETTPNTDAVLDDLGPELANTLAYLLETSAADIEEVIADITPVLATAYALGNLELSAELEDQLRGLVELNRIRVVRAGWGTIRVVFRTALAGLAAGVRGVST